MFSTLKCSNFSVNIVGVAGVFFLFFLFLFRAAVTLTLRTTKKKAHQKPPATQASVNRAKY